MASEIVARTVEAADGEGRTHAEGWSERGVCEGREGECARELTREITLPILLPIVRTYAYAYGLLLLPFTLARRSRLTHLHTPVHPRDPPPTFSGIFPSQRRQSSTLAQRAAVIHLTLPRNSRPAAAGLVLLMMACQGKGEGILLVVGN